MKSEATVINNKNEFISCLKEEERAFYYKLILSELKSANTATLKEILAFIRG